MAEYPPEAPRPSMGAGPILGAGGDHRPPVTARMILGLAVIALGVLWTLDNLDLLEADTVVRWWPILVIGFGAAKLFGLGTRRNGAAGTILLIVGVWLLAGGLGVGWVDLSLLFPLLLVALGVHLITRSTRTQSMAGSANDPSATLSTFAFWSGIDRKAVSHDFRGGDVTAVMGGVDVDLRQAKATPQGAVLDLFVWWGGVDIKVSESWKVVNEANVLMGGIEDKSKAPAPDARDTLILRGLVVMGGVEIRN